MRWEASELCVGSCDRLAGSPGGADPADPASVVAASAAATPLAKRRTGRFVEEVERLRVDGDRHLVSEPELNVWRERGDQVRPRPDHALLVLGGFGERLVDSGCLTPDLTRVDLEVRHRLAAERLDELDACPERRQALVPLPRVEVAGA